MKWLEKLRIAGANMETKRSDLPSVINFLHRRLRLSEYTELEKESKYPQSLGHADYNNAEIKYLRIGDDAEIADTIIHELLHFICHHFAAKPASTTPEEEERTVTVFATGISTLMRQNPTLFQAFQEMFDASGDG